MSVLIYISHPFAFDGFAELFICTCNIKRAGESREAETKTQIERERERQKVLHSCGDIIVDLFPVSILFAIRSLLHDCLAGWRVNWWCER